MTQKFMTGTPISLKAFRGSESEEVHIDPLRGAYFTNDPEYARSYGPVVSEFVVTISNPVVVTEAEAAGLIEIDREILMDEGYDGRLVVYDDGGYDVICFHLEQACFQGVEPTAAPAQDWGCR